MQTKRTTLATTTYKDTSCYAKKNQNHPVLTWSSDKLTNAVYCM